MGVGFPKWLSLAHTPAGEGGKMLSWSRSPQSGPLPRDQPTVLLRGRSERLCPDNQGATAQWGEHTPRPKTPTPKMAEEAGKRPIPFRAAIPPSGQLRSE